MKCKNCKGIYKYQSRGEYNTFSPMFYIENYDSYKKKMMCKEHSEQNELKNTEQNDDIHNR